LFLNFSANWIIQVEFNSFVHKTAIDKEHIILTIARGAKSIVKKNFKNLFISKFIPSFDL
jgi:hypothetical protein